jgi:glucose-1-phosphate cytidylyltransferase
LSQGGRQVDLIRSDIHDWRITFVDTGLHSNIGQRFCAVRHLVEKEEMFLANYSDGLTDMSLPDMIDAFKREAKTAAFVCAPPSQTFHVVNLGDDNRVAEIQPVRETGLLVNCGFFVFRPTIFDHIRDGEELVGEPFARLIANDQLMGYRYDRFWAMDTFKEQQELSDLCARGEAPWEVWKQGQDNKAERKVILPDFDSLRTAPAA